VKTIAAMARRVACAVALAGAALSSQASTYTFQQQGYDTFVRDGDKSDVLSGIFTAVDLDNDGLIDFDRAASMTDEVTAFTARLTSRAPFPSLAFDLLGLGRLKCQVVTGSCQFIDKGSMVATTSVPAPTRFEIGPLGGTVDFDGFPSVSTAPLIVAQAPEPSTTTLLVAGLLGLAFWRRAGRRRGQ